MSTDLIFLKPGRPVVEADNEIVAYVQCELARGRTFTHIWEYGLTICAYSSVVKEISPVRPLRRKGLEAAYRKIVKSRVQETQCAGYTLGSVRHVGGLSHVPVGLPELASRKRGRPKKS